METPMLVQINAADAAQPERRFEAMKALLGAGYSVDYGGAPAGGAVALMLEEAPAEPAKILARVEAERETRGRQPNGEWKPWFPVVDYDRCTHCMQCHPLPNFG